MSDRFEIVNFNGFVYVIDTKTRQWLWWVEIGHDSGESSVDHALAQARLAVAALETGKGLEVAGL